MGKLFWSSRNFGPKTELILSEDLFLSSPNFGQENGLILSEEIFLLVFIIFKFSGPPAFENPAYATESNISDFNWQHKR